MDCECTYLPSYCIKLGILQVDGSICTHLSSYCTKLSILQVVGPICTHLTSCCMVWVQFTLLYIYRGHVREHFNDADSWNWWSRNSLALSTHHSTSTSFIVLDRILFHGYMYILLVARWIDIVLNWLDWYIKEHRHIYFATN